jgi:hypothetical protein
MNKNKHDYLMTLIHELEKEGNATKLDNFIIAVEDLLQIKYRLRNYFNYPISAPQYDELIERAETLLGIDASSGRTNDATSVESANVDINLVNHVLKNYTPDQLTIDIVKEIAAKDGIIDGMKINKDTATYIEMKIKENQKAIDGERVRIDTYDYTKEELEGTALNGLHPDQWIAFTAKQDIKKGDFVLIDEHDNQSVTPAKDMEVSPTTLEDLFKEFELKKGQPDYKVETIDVNELVFEQAMKEDITELSDKLMDEYKDAYAALGKEYHYGVMYSLEDVKKSLDMAPEELKMIWYYSPFQQFFVGDITGKRDFPFIYKNEDPSHNDYVKNTAVIGPFRSIDEVEWYFDLLVHENAGMDDAFIKELTELVAAIKFYESRNDTAKYDTIIDSLWSELKTFLMGNI